LFILRFHSHCTDMQSKVISASNGARTPGLALHASDPTISVVVVFVPSLVPSSLLRTALSPFCCDCFSNSRVGQTRIVLLHCRPLSPRPAGRLLLLVTLVAIAPIARIHSVFWRVDNCFFVLAELNNVH
jgi:hypothetical protein